MSTIEPQLEDEGQLSVGEKVGYGLGDTASNFYWKLFENFQLYFYTDVFGISSAAAATMFLVTKLWDAVNDPIVGIVADRTRTTWGRFRPYLLWMSLPFAITGILTFYTPDLSPKGKLIYAYVTYTMVFMAYTAINIPYGALLGVISSNSIERTSASTYRFVCAFFGGLIVQKFTEPLINYFGGWEMQMVDGKETVVCLDPQTGFFYTVVCYAIAAVFLFVATFMTTKERVQPLSKKNNPLKHDFADLMRNRPWVVLLFVGLFQILSDWTRGSAVIYYFKYYANAPFSNFLVAGSLAAIAGMLLTRHLTERFSKRDLLIAMNLVKAILTVAFLFIKPDQVWLMYTLHIIASFVTGPIPILLWAMYADVADYSEWKTKRRATGLIFAAATFSQKMGGAIGSAVPGWGLYYYGFKNPVDNVAQAQSAETVSGIVKLMSIYPAVFLLGAVLALFFYNIDAKLMKTIESDLKSRKHAADEDSSDSPATHS